MITMIIMIMITIGFYEPEQPRFGLPQVSLKPEAIIFRRCYRNGLEETRQIASCILFLFGFGSIWNSKVRLADRRGVQRDLS